MCIYGLTVQNSGENYISVNKAQANDSPNCFFFPTAEPRVIPKWAFVSEIVILIGNPPKRFCKNITEKS